MFSTISSFLSSATQSQDDKRAASAASNNDPRRHPNPNNHPLAQDSASVAASNESSKPNADESQARRKRNTQETFIVVRPPPAKSNHPLNLQVQLVPPQARGERGTGTSSSRRSTDFSTDGAGGVTEDGGHALTRTSSNRSDTSMYSGYSSVSSFSSVASSSTSSARRMIIPLYNLQAHNVMTNTIVDAGTDAKVAKLSRKGLEILGLALLEPVEIFGAHTALAIPGTVPLPPSARTSIDSRDAPPPHILMPSTDRPQTPVSEVSYSSAGADTTPVQAPPMSAPEPMPQTTTGAKKIFGRLFKKRDSMAATPSQSASSSSSSTSRAPLPLPPTSPTASLLRVPKSKPGPPKRMSWAPTSARSIPDTGSDIVVPQSPLHLQPTVLGIQPVLSSPHIPPRGRPHSYAWIVRRWIKGADEGLLGGVLGLVGAGGADGERRGSVMSTGGGTSARTGVEVQFVWSRGKAKASTAAARDRTSKVASGEHASESSLGSAHHQHQHQQARSRSKRNSVISTATASTAEHAGFDAAGGTRGGDDEGEAEESDPEDSETPWTCTLVVRRVGVAIATPEDMIRLKVATFSPTPHHPKVVALLKVPFPLPDISIDTLSIHRRVVSPQGLARPGSSSGGPGMGAKGGNGTAGLVLTAEEVKDVVCSTGLWLVVRESVGGVGKVSRKGDGWRIRA